ncbi:hypothetical protein HOY82DRAFT_605716 [Tuber indicum]|nr:hypothetical protein HOY82DRAFT_605716 [Tuber indicum]
MAVDDWGMFGIDVDSSVATVVSLLSVPGVRDAAFFLTESGFDLTFGRWFPYTGTIYGKRDAPIQDKKWQYEIATQRWTDREITLKNWFRTNTSRRISSPPIAWIPSLNWRKIPAQSFMTRLLIRGQTKPCHLEEYLRGLVHITTATNEVFIQLGGRTEWLSRMNKWCTGNERSSLGSKNGGSAKKALANGWSDLSLETIMELRTGNPNPPTGVPSGPGTSSNSSKTNNGAIAGSVVAGVAAVALVFLSWMMLHQRHQRRRPHIPQVNRRGVYVTELSPGVVFARHRNPVGPPVAGAGALGGG